MACLPELCTS